MASVNKVIILGRLGGDPELKYTPAGDAYCKFSVATSKKIRDKEKTEWHRCTAWRKTAEVINQYLRKGSQVYLEGEIETQEWEKNGEKRYSTGINVFKIDFIGDKSQDSSNSQGFNHDSPANESLDKSGFTADDIPF